MDHVISTATLHHGTGLFCLFPANSSMELSFKQHTLGMTVE